MREPVLLVDVDGVISLWGFASDERPDGIWTTVDGIPHFLSKAAGRHLLDLAATFELVWCTGWEEKADEHLPAALGVPAGLAHLSFDAHVAAGTSTPGHWKLGAIDAYVADRPVAWVDDAFNEACHAWARAREAPTLLVETTPDIGLVDEHAAALRSWAAAITASLSPDGRRSER